jgi:hypothetical protein
MGELRSPLCPADPALQAAVTAELQALGIAPRIAAST